MIVMGISSRSRRPAARWAAVVVLLVVGLSGCSSGGSLAVGRLPSHTTSASVAASTTPSSTKLLSPQDQAVATVRQFFEALTTASTTGNTAPALLITSESCSCRSIAESIAKDYDSGQHVEGGVWTLSKVKLFGIDRQYYYWDVTYSVAAARVIRRDGSVVRRYGGHTASGQVVVSKTADGWRVARMTRYVGGSAKGTS